MLQSMQVPGLTQLPQFTPENNFSGAAIGDGVEPSRSDHAKANVV
jgi:hypothetical protein